MVLERRRKTCFVGSNPYPTIQEELEVKGGMGSFQQESLKLWKYLIMVCLMMKRH